MAVTSSTSASNIYASITKKNKGLGGLISGLDTDSLVEALTQSTRNRIAKQQQSKQLLQWKQTAYRSVTTALNEFKAKYFDYTTSGANNMLSPSTYNVYKATVSGTSSSAISVTTSSSSQTGKFSVNQVSQLATSQKYTSAQFSQDLTGDSIKDLEFAGKTITFQLDGQSSSNRTIKLDSLASIDLSAYDADPNDPATAAAIATTDGKIKDALEELLTRAYGSNDMVSVSVSGGKITFDSDNKINITSGAANLGFNGVTTNKVTTGTAIKNIPGLSDIIGAGSDGKTFTFKINGKTISGNTDETMATLMSRISNSGANAKLTFDSINETFALTATNSGAGNTLEIEDVTGNFLNKLLGVQGGSTLSSISSDVTNNLMLDGKNLSGADTAKGILDTIRNADPADPDNVSGSATMDITYNGVTKQINVEVTDTQLAALNVKLLAKYNELSEAAAVTDIADIDLGTLTPEQLDTYNKYMAAESQQLLGENTQKAVNSAFGFDSKNPGVSFYINTDGTSGFRVANNSDSITLSATGNSGDPDDLYSLLGFSGASVNNTTSPKLSSLGLTGSGSLTIEIGGNTETVAYSAGDTVTELIAAFDDKFGAGMLTVVDGKLVLNAANDEISITDSSSMLKDLFGVTGGTYATAVADASKSTHEQGVNAKAVVTINGTTKELTSTTNKFTINGSTVTVNEEYNKDIVFFDNTGTLTDAGRAAASIGVDVAADQSGLVDKIKTFVEDYNAMITVFTKMLAEEKYSDYPPLTEEQKADMTTEEIDAWEVKAKSGVLRNDSTVQAIMRQMRDTLYKTVEAAGLAPYQIGLETASIYNTTSGDVDYSKSGLIVLNEDKLNKALEDNADAVRTMFTDSTNGFANSLNTIIEKAASTSSTSRGTLVTLAGTSKLTGNNTSVLGDRMDAIDKIISNLKYRLENEYARYWKKFSALETAISNMSAQSSWLSEQS